MQDLVLAVERAYVQAATGGAPDATGLGDLTIAAAAIGAVASRFLAVGTPRSIGLVGPPQLTRHSLAAHRTWFHPRDIRTWDPAQPDLDAAAIDEALVDMAARPVGFAEALAADIVCIHAPIALAAIELRRGTHVNVLDPGVTLDEDLQRTATISREVPDLAALAGGLIDGRQLDELTVFVIGHATIARAAIHGLA